VLLFEYGVIRYMPRVERQEFINVGIVFSCQQKRYLCCAFHLDRPRLTAFAPHSDLDFLDQHLQGFHGVCEGRGALGALPLRERFHWLCAPRSTIIQVSPVHSGLTENLERALEQLMQKMVY
jgi:hypothetical protein